MQRYHVTIISVDGPVLGDGFANSVTIAIKKAAKNTNKRDVERVINDYKKIKVIVRENEEEIFFVFADTLVDAVMAAKEMNKKSRAGNGR